MPNSWLSRTFSIHPSPRGYLAAALGVVMVAASALSAADTCDLELAEAARLYEAGSFEPALSFVETCLQGKPKNREKAEAYLLRSRICLALDDLEGTREAVRRLLAVDSGFIPARTEPAALLALVAAVRMEQAVPTVASASKFDEPLREAPATVVIVTASEIARRGYLDLEAVLHDLPGFDISRSNGRTYSNIYQRGFRSHTTDRTMLLVDGVEQNRLMCNVAYLSRQFPLSNIERLEVVYGPASTIHGANAFTGVINIITRAPESILEPGQRFAINMLAGGGSFATRYLDFTAAGRTKNRALTWSLTGRVYQSDENDLSGYPEWSLPGPSDLRDSDYYFDLLSNAGSEPNPEAVRRYREDDRRVLSRGYSDKTNNLFLYSKVRISKLLVGVQVWRRSEGSMPAYTVDSEYDAKASRWDPQQLALYADYSTQLGEKLSLNFFTRYKRHDLGSESALAKPVTFGAYSAPYVQVGLDSQVSQLNLTSYLETSTQVRSELNLYYQPSETFKLMSGIDFRKSSIQTGFAKVRHFEPYPSYESAGRLDHTDIGLLTQVSYRPGKSFKVALGGRVDLNERKGFLRWRDTVDSSYESGFHSVFTPSLALIYMPKSWTFKVIYAEAFKDRTDLDGLSLGIKPVPGDHEDRLEPEKVSSFELSAAYENGESFGFEIAAYQATYSDTVFRAQNADGWVNSNGGDLRIRGVQISGTIRRPGYEIFGNYTLTDPYNTEPPWLSGLPEENGELRVGDIATHHVNLGINMPFKERFNLNLRANYVGSRPTGAGTTVANNPLSRIDAYLVGHASLTVEHIFPGANLQLMVNNLLDSEYEHPGVQDADGEVYAARLPQPGRSMFLRLTYRR